MSNVVFMTKSCYHFLEMMPLSGMYNILYTSNFTSMMTILFTGKRQSLYLCNIWICLIQNMGFVRSGVSFVKLSLQYLFAPE